MIYDFHISILWVYMLTMAHDLFRRFFSSQVDTPTSAFSLAWKLREVFHTKHQKSAAADITAVLGKTCAEWDYGFIMVHLEVSYDLG